MSAMGKKRADEQAMYQPVAHGFACGRLSVRDRPHACAEPQAWHPTAVSKQEIDGVALRPCETGCSGKGVHIEWSESVLSNAIWQSSQWGEPGRMPAPLIFFSQSAALPSRGAFSDE